MIKAARPRFTATIAICSALLAVGCGTATPDVAATPTLATTPSSSAAPSPPTSASPPTTARSTQSPPPGTTTRISPTPSEPVPADPAPAESGVLPTDLSGAVYGYITAVDVAASQLTVDKVDWFTGAAAEQACAEDGVPQEARLDEWCSMYYFRNVNPTLRVATVDPQVAVTTLDGNVPTPGDLASLANRITTPTGSTRPYRLMVVDGVVTEVTEVYQP